MVKIFVYGTLKKGYGLNGRLKGCNFIGEGILEGFQLYCNGYYPMIQHSKNQSSIVKGEIYEVEDNKTLAELDSIESAYNRTKVKVKCNDEMLEVEVYVYAYDIVGDDWNSWNKFEGDDWSK